MYESMPLEVGVDRVKVLSMFLRVHFSLCWLMQVKADILPEQTNHLALFLILSYAFSAPKKITNPTKSCERDEDARRKSDQSEQELLALQEGVNATDSDLNVYLCLLNLYQ